MLSFYVLSVSMRSMLDSVALGLANVSLLAGAALAVASVLFVSSAIRKLVGRGGRRGGQASVSMSGCRGARTGASLVNTSTPAGFTCAGGSALWPATLVGPPTTPGGGTSLRGRGWLSGHGQRRRISSRGAAALHHRVDPHGGQS